MAGLSVFENQSASKPPRSKFRSSYHICDIFMGGVNHGRIRNSCNVARMARAPTCQCLPTPSCESWGMMPINVPLNPFTKIVEVSSRAHVPCVCARWRPTLKLPGMCSSDTGPTCRACTRKHRLPIKCLNRQVSCTWN